MDNDARFMALALALGRRGLGQTWPNPSVGAVVVRDEGDAAIIVGRGVTCAGGARMPKPKHWHARVLRPRGARST